MQRLVARHRRALGTGLLVGTFAVAGVWQVSVVIGDEPVPAESDPSVETIPAVQCPEPIDGPSQEVIDASIGRGIDFLLVDQNPDGSWGSATRTKGLNIYAPIPGAHHAFRAATTAMGILALYETGGDREDAARLSTRPRRGCSSICHMSGVQRAMPCTTSGRTRMPFRPCSR